MGNAKKPTQEEVRLAESLLEKYSRILDNPLFKSNDYNATSKIIIIIDQCNEIIHKHLSEVLRKLE